MELSHFLSRMGFAAPLSDGLKRTYAAGTVPFGLLIHGRTVADLDGTFPLSAAAVARLVGLRQVRAIPAQDASTEEP